MDIRQTPILISYLRQHGHIGANERVKCMVLSGGVSCNTILVKREAGRSIVVKQALERLKVSEEWISNPKRIHIEAAAMRSLKLLTPQGSIPKFLFEDFEEHIAGMEAVPFPHENWKSALLKGQIIDDHFIQFGKLLANIHLKSSQDKALIDQFSDQQFFESLRLSPYYAFTATQVPEAANFLHALITDTRNIRVSLVHGDYSPKNVLIHNGRLILLDHEVAHFGDGAFDLGFSMTHFLSKARHLPLYKEQFLNVALHYWEAYKQIAEPSLAWEKRAVRHTIACMLARVKGKSQLEYLTEDSKHQQLNFCLEMLNQLPNSINAFLDIYRSELA